MDDGESLESLSDHELLARSAVDGRAFERFCERCLPSLYKYSAWSCQRLGVPSDLAKEFVHDAILKVLKKTVDGESGTPAFPKSFLRTTIRNLVIDWKRHQAISEFVAVLPFDVEGNVQAGPDTDDADEVHYLLNLLRPEEAELIERVLLSGVSFEALAEELDLSVDAAAQRYYRALRRLRDLAKIHGRKSELEPG